MNNKLEKKIFKVHMKTVVKISYYMLKGDINTENIKITSSIVSKMISKFTLYMFEFEDKIMNKQEHHNLSNIVCECILKVSALVDDYIPEDNDVLKISSMAGKMVLKTNKIINSSF
jgi:hypothetical protein|tara:strand:+ start:74 stop:421 length:348 start_codon:yes stop_codon:yes gene_type:complete